MGFGIRADRHMQRHLCSLSSILPAAYMPQVTAELAGICVSLVLHRQEMLYIRMSSVQLRYTSSKVRHTLEAAIASVQVIWEPLIVASIACPPCRACMGYVFGAAGTEISLASPTYAALGDCPWAMCGIKHIVPEDHLRC